MKKLFFTLILFSSVLLSAQTKNDTDFAADLKNTFAKSTDCVNDFEKILTPAEVQSLNTTLSAFEKKYIYKIVIITTPSYKPFNSFEEFAMDIDKFLSKDPRLDPTLLIMVSKTLRQIQVLSVDFIKYKLNNEETQNIVSTYAVPELKKGDYYKALELASNEFMKKLQPN
ncbi:MULTISPECIES: TPM domain-containing protein [Flavobacterium]|uniref:TPM domain-containing protein n=1 Tax=Flavobacterium endoglycinae TaxID=2816357 RepID=A0ABX7QAT2_9FLAO|nr:MULTISPECIES: TPM domain-containing protein [Flavobacterium]QSW88127.1 TPM domain-containing protein [Flavobacterium endoglycinae]